MSAGAAFDRLAPRYDEVWTNSAVGRAQRDAVWRETDLLFRRGDCILDIGCGTGEDAAHFTARGITVCAIDASPAMVEQARRRGGFSVAAVPAETLRQLGGSYEGAISNFGVLNCVGDLAAVSRDLAELVRPGGAVVISTIGRFCAWEVLYYAARLQFAKALRRLHRRVTWSGIRVAYPPVREIRAAFAPSFRLLHWKGIGVFVPPSYVSLPRSAVRVLQALDSVCASLPLLRGLADHRLVIFVRE